MIGFGFVVIVVITFGSRRLFSFGWGCCYCILVDFGLLLVVGCDIVLMVYCWFGFGVLGFGLVSYYASLWVICFGLGCSCFELVVAVELLICWCICSFGTC